jgi:tRNA 2-thiouridine synthesizing protein A
MDQWEEIMNDSDKNKEIKPDEVLDCVGLYCPVPIFETRKKINSMGDGQVLKMMADDPGSRPDMQAWSKTTGNELLKVEEDDGVFTFFIKKTE